MKFYTKPFVLMVLCLFAVSCAAKKERQPVQKPTPPDKAAEQATFTSLAGDTLAVSDFKGKVVVIDFWETWCKPCLASMPALNKLQKKYPNRLKILAVTAGFTDTKKNAEAFAKKHNYSFTYALDTNNLHTKLHVRGIPYKIFIDPKGKFIKKQIGSRGPKGDFKHIQHIVEKYTRNSNGKSDKNNTVSFH